MSFIKENQLSSGFLLMDMMITLSLLTFLITLSLFFTTNLPSQLSMQLKIITQIEIFRNAVSGLDHPAITKKIYKNNQKWLKLQFTTSSNITLSALVPYEDQ